MKMKLSFFLLMLWCTSPYIAEGASLWERTIKKMAPENDTNSVDSLLEEMLETPKEEGEFLKTAEISVLDRRLGKVSKPITITTDKEVVYAGMSITLKKCWRNKEERWDRDARALLTVKQAEESQVWIFSKFPSLSQFKNERYDILLKQCK